MRGAEAEVEVEACREAGRVQKWQVGRKKEEASCLTSLYYVTLHCLPPCSSRARGERRGRGDELKTTLQ